MPAAVNAYAVPVPYTAPPAVAVAVEFVPPLAIATMPVTLAAVPVVFWLKVGQVNVPVLKSPEVGVPKMGVTKVGEVANTKEPEPVSSVTAEANCADVATKVLLVRLIVLFVSVSVVSRPTSVVVASGNVTTRPAVDTASNNVTALAAEPELLNRMPLLKSVPSLIVTRPEPLG